MSQSLKRMLEKNRNRKEILEENLHDIYDVGLISSRLPREKPLNKNPGEADQCFIIVTDIHSYERDKKAYELCMESLPILNKMYNVTKVVQLGDLLEGGALKPHPVRNVYDKTPEYAEELEWAVNDFWKPAMKACPKANFYALFGNHEDWINKWLAQRLGASDLSQSMFEEYSPRNLYEDLGIHVTPYGNEDPRAGILTLFPGLVCIHGWSCSVNAAKTHLDKLMGANSIIFGHIHRKQEYTRRNPITNDSVGSWSFGALAKTNLLYQRGMPCDHVLGFGIVLTHKDSFQIVPLEIKITASGRRKLMLPTGQILER